MKINGKEVITNGLFAYDGCHKIYILEDPDDEKEVVDNGGYDIFPIEDIEEVYKGSCDLRFIENWKLTKRYVEQFEDEDNPEGPDFEFK